MKIYGLLLFLVLFISHPGYSQVTSATDVEIENLAHKFVREHVTKGKEGLTFEEDAFSVSVSGIGIFLQKRAEEGHIESMYLLTLLGIYIDVEGMPLTIPVMPIEEGMDLKTMRMSIESRFIKPNLRKVTAEGVYHPRALNLRSILAYYGVYQPQSVEAAIKFADRAVVQGSDYAAYNLSYIYFMQGNFTKARDYAQKAVSQNVSEAQALLDAATQILDIRRIFFNPHGNIQGSHVLLSDVDSDELKMELDGRRKCEEGDTGRTIWRGEGDRKITEQQITEYYNEKFKHKHFSEVVDNHVDWAQSGYVKNQYALALYDWSDRSEGVKSAKWLTLSSQAGYPPALNLHGLMAYYDFTYKNRNVDITDDYKYLGVSDRIKLALTIFRRAKNQGSHHAVYNIAYIHFISGDFEKAIAFGEEAATFQTTKKAAEVLLLFAERSLGLEDQAIQSVSGMLFEDMDTETLSRVLGPKQKYYYSLQNDDLWD